MNLKRGVLEGVGDSKLRKRRSDGANDNLFRGSRGPLDNEAFDEHVVIGADSEAGGNVHRRGVHVNQANERTRGGFVTGDVGPAEQERAVWLSSKRARHEGPLITMHWRNKRAVDRAIRIQMGDARCSRTVECLKCAGDQERSVCVRLDVFYCREECGRFRDAGPLHATADVETAINRAIRFKPDDSARRGVSKSSEVTSQNNASVCLDIGILDWQRR